MTKFLRLLILVAAAAPGLSQSESEPYFSLFSNRTFGTTGKPSVSFSAWNIDSLEFRVYRVNDPMQFFEQIEDPHQFGGRVPRPPRERTMLERIHMWKRGVRAHVRRSLRAQFTEPPSSHFATAKPALKPTAAGQKGTQYAEAPLLNSQQLVLSFVQPVQSHNRWERENVDVMVADRGVYLVEAVHGELRAYTVLVVSDIAMITKTGKGRIVNLLVDRATGQPIPGAKIAMLGRDKQIGEVETNGDGIAEMRMPGKATDVRVIARRGGDYAVNTLSEFSFAADAEQWTGYLYTDRPVYRPGHTVHFKGILRLFTAAGYAVPAGKNVTVTVNDPDQKPIYEKTLLANANGTVRDEFTLGTGAALGNYFMQVRSGEGFMSANFEVQEYKKPEYEVRVTPAKTRVLQGEEVQAVIDARYYFGEPVGSAKVTYAVYRERYWFPLWYDPEDDDFDRESNADGDGDGGDGGDQVAQTDGQLDPDGKLTIKFPTSVSDRRFDYRYRIEARVTDQANREISGRGWVVATYGSFVVNLAPERYFYAPGSRARFQAEARDYDNKRVATHARVELQQWNPRETDKWDVKASSELDIGLQEIATATLDIPPQGGSYRARITARTPEGRDVESYSYVWVSGGSYSEFRTGTNRSLQIVADKKTYRAGDTVKLLIIAGQPNTPVLVTVEGRDLREYKLVRSQDSTASFELPVAVADEPGITVSAAFVRKGNLHVGTKYIKVPAVEHQLNVNLRTDKPQYLPGQPAEYSIDVTSADGKPAPRAEFSLGVVDEAIYAIHRDTTPDILTFFFDRQWNRVATDASLNYYFHGEAGKRRMRLAELRPASRLAQLKPERLVQPKVRKVFPDTAFWAADLVTDAAGHAHAKVEFPDSLTTWRATARGATFDTKVGSATLKTIVRKNVILRLVTPRFFVQGDEVTISALVHNYLTEPKNVRVSLKVEGLDLLQGTTRDLQAPSRGEVKVEWRVRAQQVRRAKLIGSALTNEESDAMELELPVNIPGVRMGQARGGSMAGGGSAAFELAFPQKVQPGSRSVAISVSPSIAGSLFGALDYLTSFPYGCVEQTMSSFLPNITVAQAVRELGLKTDLDKEDLQEKIRAGLDRLYNFQHQDGGWGWWQTDQSHPFMTAYVVAGLVQAQSAGTQVSADAVQRGAAWLKQDLAKDPRLAPDLRAYMIYAIGLAGQNDAVADLLGGAYDTRRGLSGYGLAILGLALETAKDPRAKEIAIAVETTAQQDDQQAWWPATRDPMLDFTEDVTAESTAYALKFLSHQRPDSALLPKGAQWLMNHRSEGYWWSSTKQTAMVIYGLTDYLKVTHELNPDITATLFVNDRALLTRRFDQAAGITAPEMVLDESKLEPGVNRIRITASGNGRLYYAARAEYFSTDDKLQKTGSISLNLLRDYFRLTPGRDGERIVYDWAPLNGPATVGDIIAVRLTATGTEWKYVMVEDPIPAGSEFIERDGGYELRNRPKWWGYWFTRRELHDNRMAIFETYFPQGQQDFFYLLKVVNPGVFQVSPARIGPMYQPGIMATTESRRLEVK